MMEGESDLPSEIILWAALLFAPLAFGTTESWSRAILAAILSCLLLTRCRAGGWDVLRPRAAPPVLWALAALLAMGLLQAALPTSPLQADKAAGIFTFSSKRTLDWLFDWSLFAGLLLLVPPVFRSPASAERLAWALLVSGSVVAVIGISQLQAGNEFYYGIRKVGAFQIPFGPFPNKNHAGAFLAICALSGAGIGLALLGGPRRAPAGGGLDEVFGKLGVLFSLEFLVLAGLLKSRSRGAIVATALAGAVAVAVHIVKAPRKGRLGPAAILGSLAALVAGVVAFSQVQWAAFIPAAGERSLTFRFAMISDGLRIIRDHPWFGIGLGSLQAGHPHWKSEALAGYYTDHLHCDPVELAAEAGILLATAYYAAYLLSIWRPATSGRTGQARALAFGFSAANLGFLIHQSLEYPSRITSIHVAALVCLCAGWGLTQTPPPDYAPQRPLRGYWVPLTALAAYWLLFLTPRVVAGYFDLLASQYPQPSKQYLHVQALRWERTFDREMRIGTAYLQIADENPAARIPLVKSAQKHFANALELEPLHPNARVMSRRARRYAPPPR